MFKVVRGLYWVVLGSVDDELRREIVVVLLNGAVGGVSGVGVVGRVSQVGEVVWRGGAHIIFVAIEPSHLPRVGHIKVGGLPREENGVGRAVMDQRHSPGPRSAGLGPGYAEL